MGITAVTACDGEEPAIHVVDDDTDPHLDDWL
jgi:hypothetical protein